IPLNKIRRLTGERMQAAWQTIPHVTQFDRADITELEALRQSMKTTWAESGVRITLLPFLMKAVALLLKDYPDVNSSLASTGKALILKKYIHLGIAVDTPEGLMVPVIRDVDQKDVAQLSRELMDVSERARSKKLKPDEFQGATFTISSLGGIGGTYFSPIVNPPQVAILGVSRASVQPVWDSKKAAFIPRTILPFSLSYDHRVIDGAAGARFTAQLATYLSDPETIATWEVKP
ncbi:MAG: branched-chain alpha-keto acid dehydrogenase subunit E2, partial [FCB group bacterium]|nr:branched-chain alpha-keto acid dehydrogenase subunit E2 [FCB group bacterium]